MPVFDSATIDQYQTGNFEYSAAKLDQFTSVDQTLIEIAFDCSSSTDGFQQEMTQAVRSIIEGCQTQAPNPDGMSLRVTKFASNLEEVMGWTPVTAVDPNSVNINGGGMTALYDATIDSLETLVDFGAQLYDKVDANVNGVLVVITDGCENASGKRNLQDYHAAKSRMQREEKVESVLTLLVRVNNYDRDLDAYEQEVGFDASINLNDVSSDGFARLANWIVSSSISQSQALGSGAPSQALGF